MYGVIRKSCRKMYSHSLIPALSLGTDLKICGQRRFLMYSQLTTNPEIISHSYLTFLSSSAAPTFVVCSDGFPAINSTNARWNALAPAHHSFLVESELLSIFRSLNSSHFSRGEVAFSSTFTAGLLFLL